MKIIKNLFILLFCMSFTGCDLLHFTMTYSPELFNNDEPFIPDKYVLVYNADFNGFINKQEWCIDFPWMMFHPYFPETGWYDPEQVRMTDTTVQLWTIFKPRTFWNEVNHDSVTINEAKGWMEFFPWLAGTEHSLSTNYYAAARIRQPIGDKQWNAFWFYSLTGIADEVDIMEYWDITKGRFTTNIHQNYKQKQRHHRIINPTDFHIYSVWMTPDTIRFYFDGFNFRTEKIRMIEPMNIILNNSYTPNLPSIMEVDWFKLYRKE